MFILFIGFIYIVGMASTHPRIRVVVNRTKNCGNHSTHSIKVTGRQKDYQLIRRLGDGTFGQVFEAMNIRNDSKCALKILKPVKIRKVIREINILERLKGGDNIIKLLAVVRVPTFGTTYGLCFEFAGTHTLSELLKGQQITDVDLKCYLYQLLQALHCAHNMGVMHRDLKPRNVMIDHEHKQLRLIDWGMAAFYLRKRTYDTWVGTRFYAAPELLIHYGRYNYSVDMWAFGCILASATFRKEPFFHGLNRSDQLFRIAVVLGTDKWDKYLMNCGDMFYKQYSSTSTYIGSHPKKQWVTFINSKNECHISSAALDLIDKLLRFNRDDRMTAQQAMNHPYFK